MILRAGGGLEIDVVLLGEFAVNCYVLMVRPDGAAPRGRRQQAADVICWVVDPGQDPQPLLDHLARKALRPERVLITHGHGDHIAGVGAVKAAWPRVIVTASEGDKDMLTSAEVNLSAQFGLTLTSPPADEVVRHGVTLAQGPLAWQVLDTSGHTPGGVSYYCQAAGVVLTGDALFQESIGRTDLPGGSGRRQLENIRRRLLTLPPETKVLPGHGPPTTIAHERRYNSFLAEQQ